MARSITRRTSQDEGTKQREVLDQPTPFVGLYLAPPAAMLFCWAVHFAIAGWSIQVRDWSWHVDGSTNFMILAEVLFTFAAVGVGKIAWEMSYDRKDIWRYALTASSTFIGAWMPFLVGIGPSRWLATFYLICAWIVSTAWVYPRLHVLRRDPREGGGDEGGEDDLIKSLGLSGFRHRGTPEVHYDAEGKPERIVAVVKHRFGATRSALQSALPNIESAVDAPEGLSRVTKTHGDKSSESLMTIVLQDPFVGRIPNPGPSHPGGSPTDYSVVGMYDDGEPVYVWICGGINPETGDPMPPTGYAFMGMSRAGKTVTENRLLLEQAITRRGMTILYLNKAKGGQDVGPIIAGVEVAVLSDGTRDYRAALLEVKKMLTYRQAVLAKYGISAWSWEKCFDNPPTHTVSGEHKPMEPMPGLIVHVGEADAILEEAGDEAIYLGSKGLSVGIICGWSLQRWDGTSMPTSLRYNIGTGFCFGTGDDYSHHFVLSDQTIKAGAHPDQWKNRKPGRFYLESIGIPDERFPVPAKGIGDTDDDALYGNMRLLAEEWGPRMDKLDRGSANATRGWWDQQVRATAVLRRELTPGTASTNTVSPATEPPPPDDPAPTPRQETTTVTRQPPTDYIVDIPEGVDPDRDQTDLARMETAADIAETTHVGDVEIRGGLITPDEDDPTGQHLFAEMDAVDPRADIPPLPPGFMDVDLNEGVVEAATPEEAQVLFDNSLRRALATPEWRDPDDPTGKTVLVRTGQLQQLDGFRSRPWFSRMLSDMAQGHRVCPPGITLEKATDQGEAGWYRIRDTSDE